MIRTTRASILGFPRAENSREVIVSRPGAREVLNISRFYREIKALIKNDSVRPALAA